MERNYKQAKIDMGPIRFFEAYGSGTKFGDPVEANAIGLAFKEYRIVDDPLYIGASHEGKYRPLRRTPMLSS